MGYGGIDFARVIDVHDDHAAQTSLGQAPEQIFRDALGNQDRQAGMHAQPLKLSNPLQLPDKLLQMVIRQGQRIPAAQNHFLQFLICSQLLDGRSPGVGRLRPLRVREKTAKTIATVNGTRTRRDQQGTAVVFTDHARLPESVPIVHGVRGKADRGPLLGVQRKNLAQQRVVGIGRSDPR